MTIDPSTIKPGGKVSVTLTDGTKIIDSPVADVSAGRIRGDGYWIVGGFIRLTTFAGGPGGLIASIDAYTPPTPEWDRPEVFAVTDRRGVHWFRRRGDEWEATPDSIEAAYGPCTVLAVYADGVER